jgi:hypothetical protein
MKSLMKGASLGAAIEPLENPSMKRAVIGLALLIFPAESRFLHQHEESNVIPVSL